MRLPLFTFLLLASSLASADYLAYSVNDKGRSPLPERIDKIEAMLGETAPAFLLLCLQRFIELAPRMRQAANRDDVIALCDSRIALIAVGLQKAVEVRQQSCRHVATA